MRNSILCALEARYEAVIAEAHTIINIYLENSVGIGEHPQHIEEVDKQLQKISDAEEKLSALEDFKEEPVEDATQRLDRQREEQKQREEK
jgi:hypothetical protein|tara:strand:+ start:1315 stop:1584 length:270 start_codon:yes stop_codon:yes gene_type:complete